MKRERFLTNDIARKKQNKNYLSFASSRNIILTENNNNNKLFQFLVWNYYRSSYYFLSSALHSINKYQSKIEWSLFSLALWKFFKVRKGLYFQKKIITIYITVIDLFEVTVTNACQLLKAKRQRIWKGYPDSKKLPHFSYRV